MDNENGRPAKPDELPGVHKTVNQIVARNIAYYRKAAGITQEELGELVGGRSKRNMSADERSWDGGHTREFNAHEIVALAAALRVPIGAFFLPPEEDGVSVRYLFHPHDRDADCLDMGDLMAMVMPDSDDYGRPMEAYRRRLIAAVAQYMDSSWSDNLDSWMAAMTESEIRAEQAEELRGEREFLLSLAAKFGKVIDAYEKAQDRE